MVEVEITEATEGYEQGQSVLLDNNDAHRLIDGNKARLKYNTRVMTPEEGGFVAPIATPAPSEPSIPTIEESIPEITSEEVSE